MPYLFIKQSALHNLYTVFIFASFKANECYLGDESVLFKILLLNLLLEKIDCVASQ